MSFDKFWLSYPNKKAKGAAKKAFEKALKETDDPDLLKEILLAIDAQKREKKRLKDNNLFCPEWPMPSTWLNQQRWADEVVSNQEVERKKQELFCECGKEARHNRGKWYCDVCFSKILDDNSGWTERLREEYKKLPPKKSGESHREWASRIMSTTGKRFGNILK